MKEPGFRCNDYGCAIAFVVCLLATLVTGAVYISQWSDYVDTYGYYSSYSLSLDSNLSHTSVIASFIGIILGILVLGGVRLCNGRAVTISFIGSILIYIGFAVVTAFMEWYGLMAFCIIMALFMMIYFCCVRARIPFAEAVVLGSVKSIFAYWGVIPVVILCSLVSLGFAIFWIHTINAVIYVLEYDAMIAQQENPMGSIYAAYVLLCLAYYWVSETIRNVGHTTTAGSVGTWWYSGNAVSSATFGSLRRAMTSSFGSIAFGSLIVAIIETLKACVRLFLGRNSCLGCLLHCFLSCIERAVRYFNAYAYTYVALYGKDYMKAGSAVSELFERNIFKAIINDDLTYIIVSFNSYIVGIISAVICAFAYDVSSKNIYFYLIPIFAFIFAYFTCHTILCVLLSAVKTTFVLWAEDPAAMQATQPESFAHISEARSKYYKN